MVNSSPEYSITKPGLHHLRKREKPIRTYGRQTSTPEAQSEPPLKKQRLSALQQQQQQQQQQQEKLNSTAHDANDAPTPDDVAVTAASEAKTKQDAASRSKPDKRGQSPKKGSILSYFKPALQTPKEDPPSPLQDSQPEEPIAPQVTPKRKHASKRKPRLLKIKATTHEPPDQSSQEPDNHSLEKAASNTLAAETTSSETPSATPSPGRRKSARNPRSSPKTKPSSPSIQTTLNISAQAPFSECRICDTVWNPLYPDDVKFHNKTHKAVLRAQKRKVDDL